MLKQKLTNEEIKEEIKNYCKSFIKKAEKIIDNDEHGRCWYIDVIRDSLASRFNNYRCVYIYQKCSFTYYLFANSSNAFQYVELTRDRRYHYTIKLFDD